MTVRHHCWLTQEPLSGYLKAQAGDDSGDEGNEATELLEMNEIEFETRDIIPLRCVLRLRKSLNIIFTLSSILDLHVELVKNVTLDVKNLSTKPILR